MPAGGFRTFVAGETLDETKINSYLMQGVLVFADSAARGSAIASPEHGMVSFLKDTNTTEFYDSSSWVALGVSTFNESDVTATTGSPGTATSGGYKYYAFTGTGSITFGRDGLADLLMIGGGGGGGGGGGTNATSGGGGAGDIRQLNDVFFAAGTATITVAAGGAGDGSRSRGGLGGNTAIGIGAVDKTHILAIGGGAGGGDLATQEDGETGASGGGNGWQLVGAISRGITQFGGGGTAGGGGGGGGGGVTAVGGNGTGTNGGSGGAGTNAYATWATATSTGVSDFYGGGGGGGGGTTGGTGGSGGGGAGATGAANGGNGTANTGSGGGGSENLGTSGGNGGSGLVIVRVLA